MRARSEAMARSQVSAQASPTPAAGPLMAAMNAVSLRAISLHDPPELVADPAPDVGCALRRGERLRRVVHHPQIAARGEPGVGAGQHYRADRAVGDELLQCDFELLHECGA